MTLAFWWECDLPREVEGHAPVNQRVCDRGDEQHCPLGKLHDAIGFWRPSSRHDDARTSSVQVL